MSDVARPRRSDSMEEGTILKWLKSDGDDVSKGEELVEIETDKANMTYESDSDGVLEIVAQEGDTLPVGETIARLGAGGGGEDSGGQAKGEEGGAEAKSEDEGDADAEAKSDDQGDEDEETEAEEEQKTTAEGDEDQEAKAEDAEGDADAEAKSDDEGDADQEPEAEGGEEAEARDGGDSGNGHREAKPEPAPARAGAGGGDGDGDGNGRVKASPVARRMAREMGVELATLEGTGPGGRIVKADVEAAARGDGAPTEAPEKGKAEPAKAEEKPAEAEEKRQREEPAEEKKGKEKAPPPVVSGEQGRGDAETVELTRLQRTVARRMAESKATAPDFVITLEVDMEEAVELRKQLKVAAGDSPAPSFNDFVIKASALALRDFPRANGAYKDGQFELYSRVNVGVAVAGMDALVVPTVFDADRKSLGQIARESRAVAERVRVGQITPPELSGGTFTVSNLGMYGIKRFVAVINPPQAAILAVGELTPRPVVRDGEIVPRHMLELTLSCDHRILYGSDAAEFLARIREYLEQPLRLLVYAAPGLGGGPGGGL